MSPELKLKLVKRGNNILACQKRYEHEFDEDELCQLALDFTHIDTFKFLYMNDTLTLDEFAQCLDFKFRSEALAA